MSKPLRKYPELLTRTVFFIGNGASRKNFDLNILKPYGTIVGCNALYRDFSPDILICQDAKMARELVDNRYHGLVLTGRGIGVRPENLITWRAGNSRTSGAFGLKFISTIIQPDICYILGLDGYPGNVYAGTHNYSSSPQKIHKVTAQYKGAAGNMKVVNVNTKDTWESKNYSSMSYQEFLCQISSVA